MTRFNLLAVLRGTVAGSVLFAAGAALAADVVSVEFTHTPAAATDAEMLQPLTTSRAIVRYADGSEKEYPLSYTRIFKNTDAFDGHAAGQVYNAKGEPVMDPNGAPVIAETPDANSLLMVDGKPYLVTHYEYDWLLANGAQARKAEGWYSRMPMSMTLTSLAQGGDGALTAQSVHPIDFSGVDGLWIPCAGGPTPWNTHLGGEEDYDLYFQAASGDKNLRKTSDGLRAMSEVYFSGEKQANPYNYGFITEVTVKGDGATEVVKHYAMGRATWELARIMGDNRTAYFGDDGTNVSLFMYVADKERDLTAGTLYAARWNQVSDADGGAATLDWIRLGHASDGDVRAIITSGVSFDDIFETTTAEATPDWQAQGFKRIRAGHAADEIVRLKTGMEQAAAFLESRRMAAWLGATTEFNKMEGIAFDDRKKNLYVAMSYVDKGMTADETGPVDHIRTAAIGAGATYEVSMAGGRVDTTGATIASDWVGTAMRVPAALLGEDIAADALGNVADPEKVANPDNLHFSPKMRTLFLGEDSGTHVNNAIWAYNVDTGKLSRILSQPSGSEATGLQVADNFGGHAYIMANNQHQGEWIKSMPDDLKARLEAAASSLFGVNGMGALSYQLEANVGYLAGLPGL